MTLPVDYHPRVVDRMMQSYSSLHCYCLMITTMMMQKRGVVESCRHLLLLLPRRRILTVVLPN